MTRTHLDKAAVLLVHVAGAVLATTQKAADVVATAGTPHICAWSSTFAINPCDEQKKDGGADAMQKEVK